MKDYRIKETIDGYDRQSFKIQKYNFWFGWSDLTQRDCGSVSPIYYKTLNIAKDAIESFRGKNPEQIKYHY